MVLLVKIRNSLSFLAPGRGSRGNKPGELMGNPDLGGLRLGVGFEITPNRSPLGVIPCCVVKVRTCGARELINNKLQTINCLKFIGCALPGQQVSGGAMILIQDLVRS